jgi:hypothetical protein
VFAVLIAAPAGPEDGCPSARQVTDAMQARFPGFLVLPDRAAATILPDVLRAVLDVAPDGTVVRFSLIDARGDTQLRRTLPAPGRGTSVTDCVAFADTVAAIVERYLVTIAYDTAETGQFDPSTAGASPTLEAVSGSSAGKAAPTRTLPFLALVGGGWRMTAAGSGTQDQNGIEARLGIQLGLTRWVRYLWGVFSLGGSPALEYELPDAPRRATLRRFPVRLGSLLELPAGPGWVEPVVQLGLDVIALSSSSRVNVPSALVVRFGPVVEAGVGYRMPITTRLTFRPGVNLGVPLKRYDIGVRDATDPLTGQPAYLVTTPKAYASFEIDLAVVFR